MITIGYFYLEGRQAFVTYSFQSFTTTSSTITLVSSKSLHIAQSLLFSGQVPVAKLSQNGVGSAIMWCETTLFYYIPPMGDQTLGYCTRMILNSVQNQYSL
jgi:hypothetical protein